VSTDEGKTPPVKSVKIVMLPDPDPEGEFLIEWWSGWFGSISPNFTLTDGWNLTAMDSSIESGGSDALSALAEMATAAAGFRAAGVSLTEGIYPLNIDANTKQWVLGPALVLFK